MDKGFTLVELLAVIVILSLIMGIGTIAVSSIIDRSNQDYYLSLETNLEHAASSYYGDYRSLRPALNLTGDEYDACSHVSLKTLVEENYIERDKLIDVQGNLCSDANLANSFVYIKRNENKQYEYKVLLRCNQYEDVLSNEDLNSYCLVNPNTETSTILISAKVDGADFDVKKSSSNIWTNKDIEVTFDSTQLVSEYRLRNMDNSSDEIICNNLTNYKCIKTFNSYGRYTVYAYDGDNLVSERNIYLRIDKDAPSFGTNLNSGYNITSGTTYRVSIALNNITERSGISKVNYWITGHNVNINKETSETSFSENLNSGEYNIKIKATDYVLNESAYLEQVFYISRSINLYDLDSNNNYQVVRSVSVVDGFAISYLNVSLPTLTSPGKTFLGWYTGISSGDLITNDTNIKSSIGALYARWS